MLLYAVIHDISWWTELVQFCIFKSMLIFTFKYCCFSNSVQLGKKSFKMPNFAPL